MKKILLISFICLIFSFSIQAQTIAGNWKLTWIVVELDMAYSIIVPITLSIEENGKISGNGGCNSFTGNYSFKKPKKPFKKPVKIKFSNIISTNLPCDKPLRAENVFFRSLRDANTIFVKNGELVIESSKAGNMMSFVSEAKPKP